MASATEAAVPVTYASNATSQASAQLAHVIPLLAEQMPLRNLHWRPSSSMQTLKPVTKPGGPSTVPALRTILHLPVDLVPLASHVPNSSSVPVLKRLERWSRPRLSVFETAIGMRGMGVALLALALALIVAAPCRRGSAGDLLRQRLPPLLGQGEGRMLRAAARDDHDLLDLRPVTVGVLGGLERPGHGADELAEHRRGVAGEQLAEVGVGGAERAGEQLGEAVVGEQVLGAGDARAFDLIVVKYQRRIERLIGRMVRDTDLVQDLAQETFIRAYRALPQFRGESAFYTWLYRIAVNTAKKALVDLRRDPVMTESALRSRDEDEEPSSRVENELTDGETPEAVLASREIARTVNAAIEALSEDLRQAITLREIEGLSYEEIATAMNCPIGTVRSRIFRAREAIAARLRPLLDTREGERW